MESYFLTIKDDDFNMQNRLLQYISYARYQKLSHYYYNIDKKLSIFSMSTPISSIFEITHNTAFLV